MPRIVQAGRDYWPGVGFALFAGAVRTGQVIDETDSWGEYSKSDAVGAQNVLGAVYHALGIDPTLKLPDTTAGPFNFWTTVLLSVVLSIDFTRPLPTKGIWMRGNSSSTSPVVITIDRTYG